MLALIRDKRRPVSRSPPLSIWLWAMYAGHTGRQRPWRAPESELRRRRHHGARPFTIMRANLHVERRLASPWHAGRNGELNVPRLTPLPGSARNSSTNRGRALRASRPQFRQL